jgi:hypothetical protein
MVHYTTAGKDTRLELVSTEETGIATLPAEFYSRTMCLANMFSKAVVASVSLYNPNTGRGSLEVRPLSWITPPPKKSIVSPVAMMPNLAVQGTPSSPRAADRTAIQDCVQAPPASAIRFATTVELESTASNHTSPASLSSLTPPGGTQLFSTDASIETPRQPAKKMLSMIPDSAAQPSASVQPAPISEETRNVEASHMAQVSPEQQSSEKPPAEAVVKKGGAITKFLKLRYGESECHPKKTLESQFEKLNTPAVPKKQKEAKRQQEQNNVKMSATENDHISKLTVSSFASSSLKASKKISPSSVQRLDQREPLAEKAKEDNRTPKTKKLLAKPGQPGGPSPDVGRPLPKTSNGQVLEENRLEREKMVKRQKKLKTKRLSNSSTPSLEGKSRQSAGNGTPGVAPKDGKVKAGHANIRK